LGTPLVPELRQFGPRKFS